MKVAIDNKNLFSLAQIFSTANFKKIVKRGDYRDIFYRLNRYVSIDEESTNLQVIETVYNTLLSSYKNEYVYKNLLLKKELLKKYSLKNSIALSEFKVGNSIADFVLLNGEARIYEIKTELDGLEKLEKQLRDYQNFADKIYVVTHSKHIPALYIKLLNTGIGIIELTNRNALKVVKSAAQNIDFNHEVLFKTLRKDEYTQIVKAYFNTIPDVPNTKIFRECLEWCKSIDVVEFQKLVINKLKLRNITNPHFFNEELVPESLLQICYSMNMSEKDFAEFQYFLTKKSKQCISHTLEANSSN